MKFTCRRMYLKAKGKSHHFHAPQYRNCLRKGTKYSMVQGGKLWKWGKNTIFLSPINFFQVILFCFSSSSYPRSCLGGQTQTQGENIDTEGKNIFPQYTVCESRTINCMAQEEGKNKDTGEKISYIFPHLEYADTVAKKDCVQREKYDLISLSPYFPPVHHL